MPHAVLFPALFFIQAFWFIAPGLGLTLLLRKKIRVETVYTLPVAILLSCMLGYGSFWIYLFDKSLGQMYSWVVLAGSIYLILVSYLRRSTLSNSHRFDILAPLILWLAVGFFYTSLTFGCRTQPIVSQPDQFCFVHNITFDNALPKLFADNVFDGQPKALLGDWHGSDRPPLQSGLVLLESPLTEHSATGIMSYQVLATLLQVLWVPLIWLLGRRLNLKNQQLAAVFILCIFSGFFFFNSVFTWPKLLAASLAGIGFSLLVFERARWHQWLLGMAAIACGLLAHSGVAFALLPLVVLLLRKRYFPGWKILLLSSLVFLALFSPWFLYQHVYDPPGDRLLKWEVAGVTRIDDRSFSKALVDSYSRAGLGDTAKNKLNNFTTIFYAPDGDNHLYGQGKLGTWRDMEFRFVFFGLGILNLGWFGILFPKFRNHLNESGIDASRLRLVLGISAVAVGLWIFILFGPGSTIIHGGSYLTMTFLFISLAAIISTFPKALLRTILLVRILYFALVWILAVYLHHFISKTFLLLSIVAGLLISYSLIKLYSSPDVNEK